MGEAQRAPVGYRLQSPTTGSYFLGSNDDALERARARAQARSAAIRRKATVDPPSQSPPPDPCLTQQQIIDLFLNCIKLASENKINQKNTWELKLIDHLSEIIKVEAAEGDTETNFQKASCTLEAGVRIYSVRVDAVHSEAYKLLSGISRAGREDEQEVIIEGDNVNGIQDGGHSKKESERKISPLSTLESSFEALNVKKFDIAFSVDPLYHQTSAQFDEGGVKGLLLNNLGVYGGCRVLFDSFELPGKCKSCSLHNTTSDLIDVSFAKVSIEEMVMNMPAMNEISPTLRDIVFHLDEQIKDNHSSSQTSYVAETVDLRADIYAGNEASVDNISLGIHEAWTVDHDEETSVVNESSSFDPPCFGHQEETDVFTMHESDVDDNFEKVVTFLFQGSRFSSKHNAWAGPVYWKYQKSKGSENVSTTESGSAVIIKKSKRKNIADVDIAFKNSLGKQMLDIFAPHKSPTSLLLPGNIVPCSNTLPEDCHYQPENLVKLFLLPNVMCLGKRRRKLSENNQWQQKNDFDGALPSWDNESVFSGQYADDGHVHDDVEHSDELVTQPRQVNKIEVRYDKTSKQVDVHTLKETLWEHIQESVEVNDNEVVCSGTIYFKQVLATFPADCRAAVPKDISPHLCFICLLHLANEHGLSIQSCPSLDDLCIRLPSSCQNTDGLVQASL
ncbi:Cnd2 domain-containing protein [Cephalotus follicularis]|uniref:Condensin complex subunit 2 n=1 Tax=Cephalotus follicularis TaxID=3775 RepID=A0A1Q3CNX5_CEPFO|nr:Cnd2 domain-containing protein [Cephalotus follicularis]